MFIKKKKHHTNQLSIKYLVKGSLVISTKHYLWKVKSDNHIFNYKSHKNPHTHPHTHTHQQMQVHECTEYFCTAEPNKNCDKQVSSLSLCILYGR